MEELVEMVKGDPLQHYHKVKLFIGEWRAFAHCPCGWKTRTIARYYSPVLDFETLWDMYQEFSIAAAKHEAEMMSLKWRLKRAIIEAWAEVSQKWGVGTK